MLLSLAAHVFERVMVPLRYAVYCQVVLLRRVTP
jgi:hypothetical protein